MVSEQEIKRLTQRFGYREYMIERYLALFGEETERFLLGNERPLPQTLRVNELVISPEAAVTRLAQKGIQLEPVAGLTYAFRITESQVPVGATTEYLLGHYFLQSPASMWAVEALDPQDKDIVVDLCAAPGGKTTLIAQLMKNQGVLVATDINRARMRGLRSNLSRMRVENTLVIRMDGAQLPSLGLKVNAVLVDAPCTGEGLIPVDPTRKQSRSLEDIATLVAIQRKLILAAIDLLKEGGTLVYSTCSFAPEENEEVIEFALRQRPVRVIETGLPLGDPGFVTPFNQPLDDSLKLARRLYPYKHQMEGFFICRLQRVPA